MRVNIYTDSKYAFLILHAHAAIWREWGMLMASGSPIKHSQMTLKLSDTAQCLNKLHCPGHQKSSDPIALGNRKADAAPWPSIRVPFYGKSPFSLLKDLNIFPPKSR
jgi:ribonuclease HI